MNRHATLVLSSLLALLSGCGSDGRPLGGSGGDGGVHTCGIKIGYGLDTFTPLSDGQEVTVTRGSQGANAYHIWGAFLARGFDPHEKLLLDYDLLFEDGTVYQHNAFVIPPLQYDPAVAGWRQHTGLYGYLPQDHDPRPDLAGGKRLRLRMHLRDGVVVDPDTGFPGPGGVPTCETEASALVTPVFPEG